jgi:hypothetical protein
MDTTLLPPDFREFLQLLNSHEVKYLLVGGYAVGFYGYPRATADMDIWVATDAKNVESVLAALAEFGFAEVAQSCSRRRNRCSGWECRLSESSCSQACPA